MNHTIQSGISQKRQQQQQLLLQKSRQSKNKYHSLYYYYALINLFGCIILMSIHVINTYRDLTTSIFNKENDTITPDTNNNNNNNNENSNTIFNENMYKMTTRHDNMKSLDDSHKSTTVFVSFTYSTVEQLLHGITNFWWYGNAFCQNVYNVRNEYTSDPHNIPIENIFVTYNISFNCLELFENGGYGTGNYIALFYGFRLSAHILGNVDLHLYCTDAEEMKTKLIIPWIMGYFPARLLSSNEPSRYNVTTEMACGHSATQPLAYMYEDIRYDLRRMAVALVGESHNRHPSATFAHTKIESDSTVDGHSINKHKKYNLQLPSPKIDDVPLLNSNHINDNGSKASSVYAYDDAIIHFRCGDFMSDKWDWLQTMPFSGYVRHIVPSAKSIGIITQPFDKGNVNISQHRKDDVVNEAVLDRCRILVESLAQYIAHHRRRARIQIHNSIHETITISFARMIMAKQSIAGEMSSFGEFGSVASFGTGHIRSPSRWVRNIDQLIDTVVLYQENRTATFNHIKKICDELGENYVLKWFWNDGVL